MTNPPPIRTKQQMFRLLSAGLLGNTVPQWFSLPEWEADPDAAKYPLWGVRSGLAGGDKRMRLNVPSRDVPDLYREWFPSGGGNLSPMVDHAAVLKAEVFESDFAPFGLNLFYVPPDKTVRYRQPWREAFREHGKQVRGLAVWKILEAYLWPSDLEDLRALLERFPGHVVEFTACDRAMGIVPNRNTVFWEVRLY